MVYPGWTPSSARIPEMCVNPEVTPTPPPDRLPLDGGVGTNFDPWGHPSTCHSYTWECTTLHPADGLPSPRDGEGYITLVRRYFGVGHPSRLLGPPLYPGLTHSSTPGMDHSPRGMGHPSSQCGGVERGGLVEISHTSTSNSNRLQ